MGIIRHKESARLLRKILAEPDTAAQCLIMKAHSRWTAHHSVRVAWLTIDLGIDARAPQHVLRQVGLAGLYHDSGKLNTPAAIINKTGPLTEDERDIIEEHPQAGYDLVMSLNKPHVARIVRDHHKPTEGYPCEYRGDNGWGELVTLADLYDSLAYARPYRPALPRDEIVTIIRKKFHGKKEYLGLLECRLLPQE